MPDHQQFSFKNQLISQLHSKPVIRIRQEIRFINRSYLKKFFDVTEMASNFSTNLAEIATYEEIKKLSKKPETLLIDVREPQELIDTGVVPTSINIPCECLIHLHLVMNKRVTTPFISGSSDGETFKGFFGKGIFKVVQPKEAITRH